MLILASSYIDMSLHILLCGGTFLPGLCIAHMLRSHTTEVSVRSLAWYAYRPSYLVHTPDDSAGIVIIEVDIEISTMIVLYCNGLYCN